MVGRFRSLLEHQGFSLTPLQTPWVRKRLALPDDELLAQMLLLTSDNRCYGGADALVEIARHIWWGWPLFALSRLPGARSLPMSAAPAIQGYLQEGGDLLALGLPGETATPLPIKTPPKTLKVPKPERELPRLLVSPDVLENVPPPS